jgi:hypothetical protein
MGKPLPLTLLGVNNPCHLHDVREMTQPDDTTNALSKHGGSLCYRGFHCFVGIVSALSLAGLSSTG